MSETEKAVELVDFMAKALVTESDRVKVTARDGDLLQLETSDEDRGRVIGRQGRVAKAMRAVLAASRPGANSRLDIVD